MEAFKDPVSLDEEINEAELRARLIHESVLSLWNVVEKLALLKPKIPRYYHVSIFGSSRILAGSDEYNEVKHLAADLVRMGCRVVTGGGPGLMEAANEGALEADPKALESSVGLRIELPFEAEANTFVGRLYTHKTFFSRLHHFVFGSSAFVVVPGGIGTLLEAAMVWQLLQVKHLYDTPLVMIGDMWPQLVEWAQKNMIDRKPMLANPKDMLIPTCVKDVPEAISVIQKDYDRWLVEAEKKYGRLQKLRL